MKNAIKILAIIAALSLTCAVMAGPTTKPAGLGKVVSVDGTIITIALHKTTSTIQTDANTTFTLDDQPATLADVKKGEKVLSVTPSSGVATEVKLASAGKNKKKPTTAPAGGAAN